jgi:hypothetical protein
MSSCVTGEKPATMVLLLPGRRAESRPIYPCEPRDRATLLDTTLDSLWRRSLLKFQLNEAHQKSCLG